MGEMRTEYKGDRPFNHPIETGMRNLYVLNSIAPSKRGLDRLVLYDYFLVHSGDLNLPDSPDNLHPKTPYTKGEWIPRRNTVKRGLNFMFSKKLIAKKIDKKRGVLYTASNLTEAFIEKIDCDYGVKLQERSSWISEQFEDLSDNELNGIVEDHLSRWDPEFNRESLFANVE